MAADARALLLPRVVASELRLASGQEGIILQLSVDRPAPCAIAVVLDLSDSCPPVHASVEKLAKLLGPLPRQWPLWFYRLSSLNPLEISQTTKLGDLLDSNVKYRGWLDDSRLRAETSSSGSFLRPVIEAIESRREDENVEQVLAIVLTDGELLDSEPIDVPTSIRLVGITPSNASQKLGDWRRAVPGFALYALGDRQVDAAVQPDSQAFYGWCEISWRWTVDQNGDVFRLDAESGKFTPIKENALKCQLSEQPTCLVFHATRTNLQFLRLSVVRLETGRRASMRSIAFQPLPPRLAEVLASPGRASNVDDFEILLDLQSNDARFQAAWKSFARAAALATECRKWVNTDGTLGAFADDDFQGACIDSQGHARQDALLVLCNREPDVIPDAHARIIAISLNKKRQPALSLDPIHPPPFGVPITEARIYYDRREACWILQEGAERHELELDGSERLEQPLLRTNEHNWIILFSGDLR